MTTSLIKSAPGWDNWNRPVPSPTPTPSPLPGPTPLPTPVPGPVGSLPDPVRVHLTQYTSPTMPDAPATSENCAAVSSLMVLRLLGLDAPGFKGEHTQAAVDSILKLSGKPKGPLQTPDVFSVLAQTGVKATKVENLQDALAGVQEGFPALIGGNEQADGTWDNPNADWRGTARHMIAVTGFDSGSNRYVVNDPTWPTAIAVPAEQIMKFGGPEQKHVYISVSRPDGTGRPNAGSATTFKDMQVPVPNIEKPTKSNVGIPLGFEKVYTNPGPNIPQPTKGNAWDW